MYSFGILYILRLNACNVLVLTVLFRINVKETIKEITNGRYAACVICFACIDTKKSSQKWDSEKERFRVRRLQFLTFHVAYSQHVVATIKLAFR